MLHHKKKTIMTSIVWSIGVTPEGKYVPTRTSSKAAHVVKYKNYDSCLKKANDKNKQQIS